MTDDNIIENVWWGHHLTHGWIALDRRISVNASHARTASLVFIRCEDWSTYRDMRKNWNPPLYTFAPNFIASLSSDQQASAQNHLAGLRSEFSTRRETLLEEFLTHDRLEAEYHRLLEKFSSPLLAWPWRSEAANTSPLFPILRAIDLAEEIPHERLVWIAQQQELWPLLDEYFSLQWQKEMPNESNRESFINHHALEIKIIAAHRVYLQSLGLPSQNMRRAPPGRHRATHCYKCRNNIDNAFHWECARCGWIICFCGACGCGYDSSLKERANDDF